MSFGKYFFPGSEPLDFDLFTDPEQHSSNASNGLDLTQTGWKL